MAQSSASPFVRHYQDADLQDLIHIFRETCDSSLKFEPVWTIGSYHWCRPYPILSPSTCFVLDDGSGRAVGYILGTPSTKSFLGRWKSEYLPAIQDELKCLPNTDKESSDDPKAETLLNLLQSDPHKAIYSDYVSYLESYPGHLHIDILPSHQRGGYGKQLIQRFLGAMKNEGCTGVYLGMVSSNDGAARFYDRCGFRRLPHVLDEGASSEEGRTATRPDGNATIYLVKDI